MTHKGQKFPRIPQDRYYTPFRPVVPLIPYISHVEHFAEPCAGGGDLIRHLSYFGKSCIYHNDLDNGVDARTDPALEAVDRIITNPPYKWSVLQPMIARFMRIAETWLLLETDFLFNGQSAPFLRHCSDVVPVGRVNWFPGTKFESRKHYAWFCFHIHHTAYPTMHPRVLVPRGITTAEEHAQAQALSQAPATPPRRKAA